MLSPVLLQQFLFIYTSCFSTCLILLLFNSSGENTLHCLSYFLSLSRCCREDRTLIMCAGGFCGMMPRTGSIVAGIYMILMTSMYIIFESGHLRLSKREVTRFLSYNDMTGLVWIIPYCYYVAIALAVLTYPVCFLLLYSVCSRNTVGMFAYVAWIVFYDLSNCIILILTRQAAHQAAFHIHHLEWFGLATRIPVDCFWLSFVITYAIVTIESRSAGRMSLKIRRISKHVPEPPRFRLGTSTKRVQ